MTKNTHKFIESIRHCGVEKWNLCAVKFWENSIGKFIIPLTTLECWPFHIFYKYFYVSVIINIEESDACAPPHYSHFTFSTGNMCVDQQNFFIPQQKINPKNRTNRNYSKRRRTTPESNIIHHLVCVIGKKKVKWSSTFILINFISLSSSCMCTHSTIHRLRVLSLSFQMAFGCCWDHWKNMCSSRSFCCCCVPVFFFISLLDLIIN